jgi:phosphoglycolate phosphatase-like HAD superfamily hydrolase
VKIAFASRNQGAVACEDLLKRFGLWHYGSVFLAMSSGSSNSKDPHFAIIKERLGIEYTDMLFVDDLPQNIMAAKKLGVTAVLCSQYKGLDWEYIDKGLAEFRGNTDPVVKNNDETVESRAELWERHKQWAIECESLKADFYEIREKWWKEKYGCEPVPMCIYDCISLTDCYHGKTI